MYIGILSLLGFFPRRFKCSSGRTRRAGTHNSVSVPSPNALPNTNRPLGSFSALKGEWETDGAHISKQAQILDTVLASFFLMSQLAGIRILAKQKDNYASAWCEMCWWKKADPLLITWTGANVMFLLHFHEFVGIFQIRRFHSHP